MLIRNRLGIDVFGTNTRIEGVGLGAVSAGETFEVEFTFDCLLTRQDYTLTVATQYAEGYSQDWLDDALSFSVIDSRDVIYYLSAIFIGLFLTARSLESLRWRA